MHENKTLKSENSQLERFREKVRKQHEILTRENEKLARKLEKVLREQGQSVKIVQNPGEYVIVNTMAPVNSGNAGASTTNSVNVTSSTNKNRLVKSNSSQLPPIDKTQQSQNQETVTFCL
jgi:hypothetical protein